MASIWQEQPKLGDFSKIVQVLIETEIEQPKAVYFGDGNETRYHTEIDPDKRTLEDFRRKWVKTNAVYLEWKEIR